MDFTFNKSFQEFAVASGLECRCVHKNNGRHVTVTGLPSDHGFNCPITALHKEWQDGAKVLWTRVKDIPVKQSNYYKPSFDDHG